MSAANAYGWAMPSNNQPGYDWTMNRGNIMINFGGRISVQGLSGGEVGGIGTYESFTVIGFTSSDAYRTNRTHYTIVFTGPNGYTPTYGVITVSQFNQCTFWTSTRFGGSYLKTYNRSITFFGYTYAPGSHVYGDLAGSGDAAFADQICTLPLTGMDRADTISIYAVCNADGSNFHSGGYGSEYCIAHITTRGVNCDVQGSW